MNSMAGFITVKCEKCKNEQVVFERPSTPVACLVCSEPLVLPRGGKGEVKGKNLGAVKG